MIYEKLGDELGMKCARFTDGVLLGKGASLSERVNFFYRDHLGSVRAVTDGAGRLKEQNDYYPFGARHMRSDYASSDNLFRFNGKEQQVTGNVGYLDYGARMYDAAVGRWMVQDPLSESYYGLSAYGYCGGNPVNAVDPDGRDPIYAKNFWGKVKTIGDDGQNSTGSYLVKGSVARGVKAATKAGEFYTGDLSENNKVMHIPTGQIQQDVQQTAIATINSGTTAETRVENGGHSLKGDVNARIWDVGTPMRVGTDAAGNTTQTWSVTPFKIGGRIQVGGLVSDIKFIWHIHPNGSNPSDADFNAVSNWRFHGFLGNTFLIDVNNSRVTFFNERSCLINIKYEDFKRMGNQEQIR